MRKVPICVLNKEHLVVDWGGEGKGPFLDLATLLDNIRISIGGDDDILFSTIQNSYADDQFGYNGSVRNAVGQGNVFCNIPITNKPPRGGGRRTKARRLTRRTRHTRRERR